MHSFRQLSDLFSQRFNVPHFPSQPSALYEPAEYILGLGGKRIRPVMCLMAMELFEDIHADAYQVATAIELFHNFTLIHDDMMDKAPLRRGEETLHVKYNEPTALLAGDVMLITAYEYLNKINKQMLPKVLTLFNTTARQVCEGQQVDMVFEGRERVSFQEYLDMIILKTSVLLGASLQLGAVLGGAGKGNQQHLYEFGKNLGIAFQVQDDYLDAFGDPGKFGKQVGGDILANKKTFLLIHALEVCNPTQLNELKHQLSNNEPGKVDAVLDIFRSCNVDRWASELKEKYFNQALGHLEELAVISGRKRSLLELANYLLHRDN